MINRERCDNEMAKRKARSARRRGRELGGRGGLVITMSTRQKPPQLKGSKKPGKPGRRTSHIPRMGNNPRFKGRKVSLHPTSGPSRRTNRAGGVR